MGDKKDKDIKVAIRLRRLIDRFVFCLAITDILQGYVITHCIGEIVDLRAVILKMILQIKQLSMSETRQSLYMFSLFILTFQAAVQSFSCFVNTV